MKHLFIKKHPKNDVLENLILTLKSAPDPNRYSSIFIDLIEYIRPYKEPPALYLKLVIEATQKDKQFQRGLEAMFAHLLNHRNSETIFADLGILKSGTFASEAWAQFRHKIIPPLSDKHSLQYLIERAFYHKSDFKWVNEIKDELWEVFFDLISGEVIKSHLNAQKHLKNALTILSYRVTSLGFENELKYIRKTEEELLTPFISQNNSILEFVNLLSTPNTSEVFILESAEQAIQKIHQCDSILLEIRSRTQNYGTDLSQSYILLRTSQQLMRMSMLIRLLTPGITQSNIIATTTSLFKNTITNINKQNSIKNLFSKNTELLAYQIAEHKSASGEHYITTTRKEFNSFFYAACAGGLVIGFAALNKALLGKLHLAPFWQHFWYGTNYALAFVFLFITGAALATKQPTMTASALASSLDKRKGGDQSFESFAITFGKVWRSQFASFAGNIIITFPTAYLIAFLWFNLTGTRLFSGPEESIGILESQQPLKSLAWLYASIAGVFLFISGIITGYIDNKVIYARIGPRIKDHPILRLKLKISQQKLVKFSDYIVRNLGGLVGNIILGFLLGYADLIGKIFGAPIDIRHITISTAYFGFVAEELNNNLSTYNWIWTAIGVIGVGFFNFLISFSMAFYVAVRSRSLSLKIVPQAAKAVWKYFKKFPLDFIYPPAIPRKKAEVFSSQPKNTQ